MTLSDVIAPAARMVHAMQKRSQVYNSQPLAMTIVGRNTEQPVFRDAIEGDMVATIDVLDWVSVFPDDQPKRLDKVGIFGAGAGATFRLTESGALRLTEGGDSRILDTAAVAGFTFTVQAWHPAPPDIAPVWYRLLLRGGSL